MNTHRPITEKTLLVGVDLGSQTNFAYSTTLIADRTQGKSFRFGHSREDYNKFQTYLRLEQERHHCDEVVVGFESTGCYGLPFIHWLSEKELPMTQVNPSHTKKAKSFDDNSPLKSDKKDPRVITNLMKLGKGLSVIIPKDHAAELRSLSDLRNQLVTDQTRNKNQLHKLLFETFPEFLRIFKDFGSKTVQWVLNTYPLPSDLTNVDSTELGKELRKISRGRHGHKEACQLIRLAKETIGIKTGLAGHRLSIKSKLNRLKDLSAQLLEVESLIEEELSHIDYAERLLSIDSIGTIHAASLIGEVGDIRSYRTQSEFLKVSGLNLYEMSSGKHRGQIKISKRGSSEIRRMLYMASLNAIRKGGIFHDYYQRYIMRHNGKMKIKGVIAVSRKLLCLIFALVRSDTNYQVNYTKNKQVTQVNHVA